MLIAPNKVPGAGGSRLQHHKPPTKEPARQQSAPQQQPTEPEPAEAVAIKEQLRTLGYTKYDPQVVQLLMDICYRNTSEIYKDAEAINLAAGGTGAELTPQDIALATSQRARRQPHPPSMRELHALARLINSQPLTGPSDKQHGIKLPPAADCLLTQNYQIRQRLREAPPQPSSQAAGPPRQHYAVKQQHKLGMNIPQQWQPPPDTAAAAGGGAQPFAPPAYGQHQQQGEGGGWGMGAPAGQAQQPMAADAGQQQQYQQQQYQQSMDVDQEEI